MFLSTKQLTNFIEKIDFNGAQKCWEWMGCKNQKGYGQIFINGKMVRAYAVSLMIANKLTYVPPYVMHKCDNPRCVNPRHLIEGDHFKNVKDSVKKRRHKNSKKYACKYGHKFTVKNTYITRLGTRSCRKCIKRNNISMGKIRRAKREQI